LGQKFIDIVTNYLNIQIKKIIHYDLCSNQFVLLCRFCCAMKYQE
jgi:hypothetical protein